MHTRFVLRPPIGSSTQPRSTQHARPHTQSTTRHADARQGRRLQQLPHTHTRHLWSTTPTSTARHCHPQSGQHEARKHQLVWWVHEHMCVCAQWQCLRPPPLPARVLVWCACVEGARWRLGGARAQHKPHANRVSPTKLSTKHISTRACRPKHKKKSQWSAGTRPRSHSPVWVVVAVHASLQGPCRWSPLVSIVFVSCGVVGCCCCVCWDVAVVDGADVVGVVVVVRAGKKGAGDDACTREGAREQRREAGSEEEEEEWCHSLDSLHRGCGHTLSPPVLSRRGAYSLPVRKAM